MAVNVSPGFYDAQKHRGFLQTAQYTIGVSSQSILPVNPQRLGAVIYNASANTVYIGPRGKADSNSGHVLPAGQALSLNSDAEVWASASLANSLVTVLEEMLRL